MSSSPQYLAFRPFRGTRDATNIGPISANAGRAQCRHVDACPNTDGPGLGSPGASPLNRPPFHPHRPGRRLASDVLVPRSAMFALTKSHSSQRDIRPPYLGLRILLL